jgi:hypothetical protein
MEKFKTWMIMAIHNQISLAADSEEVKWNHTGNWNTGN